MAMRVLAGGVLALGLLGSVTAFAQNEGSGSTTVTIDPIVVECTLPFKPAVSIDGAAASIEQINEMAARIRRYQDQLNKYRACLEPMMTAAQDANEHGRFDELIAQYNESVETEETIVTSYQKVVNDYNRANPE